MEKKARTARQRARDEITAEILAAARARLSQAGPGELSLRAVARDVGMVSSAVYRYFASRDELLTALLVHGYNELGLAAENADEAVPDRADDRQRWMATCRAVRTWALSHPHDYALLYGSPVTDYAAPQETITPASRVVIRLIEIVTAGLRSGAVVAPTPAEARDFATSIASARHIIVEFGVPDDTPAELIGRMLMAWSSLFGTISFELWGHLVGSVDDYETYFDEVAARLWHDLGGT